MKPIGMFAAVGAFLVAGCQTLQPYRPVSVAVRDAETKLPIAGAQVRLSSGGVVDADQPSSTNGVALVRAAAFRDFGSDVHIQAAGYLNEERYLGLETVQHIETAGWLEKLQDRPPTLIVELYADPRPTVTLVVPSGYRGVINVTVDVHEDAPFAPGQRTFRADVGSDGSATLIAPPLLKHLLPTDFEVASVDGVLIKRNAADAERGFWWLHSDGKRQLFYVGTRAEYDAFCKTDSTIRGAEAGQDKGRGTGGGRRGGRRGGRGSS